MYGGDPQHPRPSMGPPLPPPQQQQHPHPHQFQQQQHQFQQQQQQPYLAGDFSRGPHPPHLMRQPSASSTNINPPPFDFHQHHHSAQPLVPLQPPYDAHADSFAAKRMRKIGQRRAVDYTSTVVRYMQQYSTTTADKPQFWCHITIQLCRTFE